MIRRLTIQKCRGKIYTDIPIPTGPSHLFHFARNTRRLQFFQPMHNTVLIPKSHDNLGNAEKKRLGPEFEQFALIFDHVSVVADFSRRFEFYPVDWIFFSRGFAVPYWTGGGERERERDVRSCLSEVPFLFFVFFPFLLFRTRSDGDRGSNVPASTSPPRTMRTWPMPVFTTEQY